MLILDPHCAPGPDGFGGAFYKKCWDIVGPDTCAAIQEFFLSGSLLENLNNDVLVLNPKVEGACNIGNFRPIVLSNFFFKIITKILADRLSIIASRIISSNQFGFIHSRCIHECIATASEVVNNLEKKNRSHNMTIKLDIRKSFNTISWEFILAVLKKFGFSKKFRNWILEIFCFAKISTLFNGSPYGFFKC